MHKTFDEWMAEVYMHAEARNIDLGDVDEDAFRGDYESGVEPWESAEAC